MMLNTVLSTLDLSPEPFNGCTRQDLIEEIQLLRQLLINADAVSRSRFCYHGLCDMIGGGGLPYPTQWGSELLCLAKQTAEVDPHLKRFAG